MNEDTVDEGGESHDRPDPGLRDGVLRLVALLSLLGVATAVCVTAGSTAFSAVITASGGLYGAWRTQR
jgi:hypothetical protein